jgi:hypothetical protein
MTRTLIYRQSATESGGREASGGERVEERLGLSILSNKNTHRVLKRDEERFRR